jgi:hypothetical protein
MALRRSQGMQRDIFGDTRGMSQENVGAAGASCERLGRGDFSESGRAEALELAGLRE